MYLRKRRGGCVYVWIYFINWRGCPLYIWIYLINRRGCPVYIWIYLINRRGCPAYIWIYLITSEQVMYLSEYICVTGEQVVCMSECLTCSLIQMGSSLAYGDNTCPHCGASTTKVFLGWITILIITFIKTWNKTFTGYITLSFYTTFSGSQKTYNNEIANVHFRPGKSCKSSSSRKLIISHCPQNCVIRDKGQRKTCVLNVGVA